MENYINQSQRARSPSPVRRSRSPRRSPKRVHYPFIRLPKGFSKMRKAELLKLAKHIRMTWQNYGGRNQDVNAVDDFTVKQLQQEIRDSYGPEYKKIWDNMVFDYRKQMY